MDQKLTRIEYLIGKEKLAKLKKKRVLICGVGGVGSFVAESLARSGVGELTLVDFDDVDISNLNRQLMSNKNNIGNSKVEELKKRLEEVSDCKVIIEKRFIDDKFSIRKKYDYVVDCIDTLTSKFILVKKAQEKNIPIICSLGSAKRIDPKNITFTTLDKTRNDPLAKAFRNLVRKERYNHKIEVVYVDSTPIETHIVKQGKTNKEKYPLGSSIFVVGSVGLYIGSIVFERLIND